MPLFQATAYGLVADHRSLMLTHRTAPVAAQRLIQLQPADERKKLLRHRHAGVESAILLPPVTQLPCHRMPRSGTNSGTENGAKPLRSRVFF